MEPVDPPSSVYCCLDTSGRIAYAWPLCSSLIGHEAGCLTTVLPDPVGSYSPVGRIWQICLIVLMLLLHICLPPQIDILTCSTVCQCLFSWLLFNMVGPFYINLLYFSLTFRGILVSHDVIGWGVVTFFSLFDWWRINTSAPLSNLNTCLTLEGVQRASEQLQFFHCDVINVQ